MPDEPPVPWWRSAVVYGVYPRSHAEGDGGGAAPPSDRVPAFRAPARTPDTAARLGTDAQARAPADPAT